jgi:hypothetical protein
MEILFDDLELLQTGRLGSVLRPATAELAALAQEATTSATTSARENGCERTAAESQTRPASR